MEKALYKKQFIISDTALSRTAAVLSALYLISEIIKHVFLRLDTANTEQLLEKMDNAPSLMVYSTVVILLHALGVSAVPLLLYQMVNKLCHAKRPIVLTLYIATAAIICEIPYKLFFAEASSTNPLCAVVVAMLMVLLMQKYDGKRLIAFCIVLSAIVWTLMLKTEFGFLTVSLSAVLFVFRKSTALTALSSSAVLLLYSLYDLFFMLAPLCCILLFFCENGGDT